MSVMVGSTCCLGDDQAHKPCSRFVCLFGEPRPLEAPRQTVEQNRASLGALGVTGKGRVHRSSYRQTDDKRFSNEMLTCITETSSKPTSAVVRDAPVHRHINITQRKIEEHGSVPCCPRCEGRGDNHSRACRDIDAAEAQISTNTRRRYSIETRSAGGIMASCTTGRRGGIRAEVYRWRTTLVRHRISPCQLQHQQLPPATPMSVEPSSGATWQAVHHEAKAHCMETAWWIEDFKPTADDPDNVRCRLGQQFQDFVGDDVHRGTPLVWAPLALFLAVSKPPRAWCWDAVVAFFHSLVPDDERIYVRSSAQGPCWVLRPCTMALGEHSYLAYCCTRPSSGLGPWQQCWLQTCSNTIHETSTWQSTKMTLVGEGGGHQLVRVDGILENSIEFKRIGRIGAGVGLEGHVLKRRTTWSPPGFTWVGTNH